MSPSRTLPPAAPPARTCQPPAPPLPAALHGDAADVLDRRLGAVARAAGHAGLHLVRRVQPLPQLLHLDPEEDRVAQAAASDVGPPARPHRAPRLGVRVPRAHAELAPDLRQVLLAHAEQFEALAP